MSRSRFPALLALGLALVCGGDARATSLAFDVEIGSFGRLVGTLELLEVTAGLPAGATVTDLGTGPGDATLLVAISLDPTSLPWGGVIDPPVSGLSAGLWILAADAPMTGGGGGLGAGPFLGAAERSDGRALVSHMISLLTFDAMPPGETSATFLVSYETLPMELSLSAWFVDRDAPLGLPEEVDLGILTVPEPGCAALALLALAALGLRAARAT